jgi:O-antigen/teichoic acid export membrane protein
MNVMVALLLNVVLNLVLAPAFGMIGSAIAWVVAILSTNLLPLLQTRRVGLHPGGAPLMTAIVAAVSTIAVPLTLARIIFGTSAAAFLVTYALALGTYSVALYLFRKQMMLDRLVSDIRRSRRVTATS